MKARTLFSAIFISGILLSAGSSIAVEDKGAESIVINGGSRGSVTFPHGRHQGVLVDCMPCHELFPKESQVIDKMKVEGKLKKKVVMKMCKKCHKGLSKKGQKTGPVACKDCHQK
jgi:Cytochrome c7 and related cytochrome c